MIRFLLNRKNDSWSFWTSFIIHFELISQCTGWVGINKIFSGICDRQSGNTLFGFFLCLWVFGYFVSYGIIFCFSSWVEFKPHSFFQCSFLKASKVIWELWTMLISDILPGMQTDWINLFELLSTTSGILYKGKTDLFFSVREIFERTPSHVVTYFRSGRLESLSLTLYL